MPGRRPRRRTAGSGRVNRELFDDRVGQQLVGQLGHPGQGGLVGGLAQLDLEPLALADADDLAESEPVARAGDGLTLRVMDLGFQHHLDDDSGHGWQRTPATGRVRSEGRGQGLWPRHSVMSVTMAVSGIHRLTSLRLPPGTVTTSADGQLAGQGHPDRPRASEEWHVTVNEAGRAASADSLSHGQPESAEFIQLLTPEGQRVEHPDYPLEISAAEVRSLY